MKDSGNGFTLPNYSSWQSNETWRPLPRREFSVRQDYDVLIGKNRHIITPSGWVHEEENLKVVLDENAKIDQVIARETGFNRYERIVNFDFSAGDTYWNKTQLFWADVAEAWSRIYKLNDNFSIKKKHEGKTLIGKMFGYTSGINEVYDQAAGKAFIQSTLNDFCHSQRKISLSEDAATSVISHMNGRSCWPALFFLQSRN